MNEKNKKRRSGANSFISLVLIFALCLMLFSACKTTTDRTGNGLDPQNYGYYGITDGIRSSPVAEQLADENFYGYMRSFAKLICENTQFGYSNTVVSPVVLMNLLALSANGADTSARTDTLNFLSKTLNTETLNRYLATYFNSLKLNEKINVHSAFWINNSNSLITPNESFLKINADYYLAKGYSFDAGNSNFFEILTNWANDIAGLSVSGFSGTLFDIQSVSMAGTLSGCISWENGFTGTEQGRFTAADGEKDVTYLTSRENKRIRLSGAEGVAKQLENGCTFVALLPDSGVSLSSLAAEISSLNISGVLEKIQENGEINIKLPEISCFGATDYSGILEKCGLTEIFSQDSDSLSGIASASGKLYLGSLINAFSFNLNESGIYTGDQLPEHIGDLPTSDQGEDLTSEPPASASETDKAEEDLPMLEFSRPFMYILFDTSGLPIIMGSYIGP